MWSPRTAARYPHRRRRPHLTLRSRTHRPLVSPDVRDAWVHGLYAAELLKTHFPTHYADHVAAQRTTPQVLLSCAEAFLYLANDTLVQLDMGDEVLSIGETHPEALFRARSVSVPEALDRLGDELAAALRWPMPWYWGMCREALLDDRADQYVLAKGILAIMHATTWHWELPDGWWLEVLPPAWADTIARVPRLPADTDVDALLACLDRIVLWDTPNLGLVVRYIHSMTGNPYADYAYDDVVENGTSLSWDWTTDALRDEGAAQREASRAR